MNAAAVAAAIDALIPIFIAAVTGSVAVDIRFDVVGFLVFSIYLTIN